MLKRGLRLQLGGGQGEDAQKGVKMLIYHPVSILPSNGS